jgi:uncharacterized integral membrane protein
MLSTFFTISSDDVATMTSYAGGLIGDAMPLILIILGVLVAGLIFDIFFHRH